MRVGRYVLAVYDDEDGRVESGERDANSGMEESKRVPNKGRWRPDSDRETPLYKPNVL